MSGSVRNKGPIAMTSMKEGDVMMLDDTSEATHKFIATGQALFSFSSGKRSIIHAGLYNGRGNILEATGAHGLRSAKLVEKSTGYKYQIWRYLNDTDKGKTYANAATRRAREFIFLRNQGPTANPGPQNYPKASALRGLFGNSTRDSGAIEAETALFDKPDSVREFYCSMFVVACYNISIQSTLPVPINRDFRYITTKELHAYFKTDSNWSQVGVYTV